MGGGLEVTGQDERGYPWYRIHTVLCNYGLSKGQPRALPHLHPFAP